MPAKTKNEPVSGNVFADLRFVDPELWQAKAHLAARVIRTVEERELNQTAAAKLLGTTQPNVSLLKKGQLDRFSLDRLIRFLKALDQDVEISIRSGRRAQVGGRLSVRT